MVWLSECAVNREHFMQDNEATLTPEELDRIKRWFLDHLASDTKCPVCGTNKFTIIPSIINAPVHIPGGIRVPGPYLPLVPIVCQNCGRVDLFSAIIMGVVPKDEPVQQGSETAEGSNG